MTLRVKFFVSTLVLLAGLIVLGSITIWNIVSFRVASQAIVSEYQAMDRADAVVVQIAWLRDSLRGASAATYRNRQYFQPIQTQVMAINEQLRAASVVEDNDAVAELKRAKSAVQHLDAAMTQAQTAMPAAPTGSNLTNTADAATLAIADELEQVRLALLDVARLVPGSVRHHLSGASDRLLHRLAWSCFWLLIVLMISVAIHILQYRALVRPLLWLRDNMQKSAAKEFKEPVLARGDAEFRDVAVIFNGLARELAELYRGLEEKVIARSRELVRSERLASVGFLAAGVAHEINNPLSVISGYAELAAKSLRRVLCGDNASSVGDAQTEADAEAEAEALAGALESQNIIRDEAFRCKEITSRLLSLARGGGDGRELLHLDEVARQVAVLTRGLRNYRDRRVVVSFDEADHLPVLANPTEMKQVLLNLTVNALEAVAPQRGEVRITGQCVGDWVEVSVSDNGKGMSTQMLEQVFEPFFTAKRGSGEPGTGLGLSITHAIIENHGGRIRAESRGPGNGSRFTIRLPVHVSELAAVHA